MLAWRCPEGSLCYQSVPWKAGLSIFCKFTLLGNNAASPDVAKDQGKSSATSWIYGLRKMPMKNHDHVFAEESAQSLAGSTWESVAVPHLSRRMPHVPTHLPGQLKLL